MAVAASVAAAAAATSGGTAYCHLDDAPWSPHCLAAKRQRKRQGEGKG